MQVTVGYICDALYVAVVTILVVGVWRGLWKATDAVLYVRRTQPRSWHASPRPASFLMQLPWLASAWW